MLKTEAQDLKLFGFPIFQFWAYPIKVIHMQLKIENNWSDKDNIDVLF
jgi:hypothetical protein